MIIPGQSASASSGREQRFHLLVRRLPRFRFWGWWLIFLLGGLVYALKPASTSSHFILTYADHEIAGTSAYPLAVAPEMVGTYPADTKSGAGYFYDDVLEYRVWVHPERGGERLNGDLDYFEAFAQWERAEEFSKDHAGAEEPVVLVRQRESINEPHPGQYVWDKSERITEWQVRWLDGSKRTAESIPEFLKHPKPANP